MSESKELEAIENNLVNYVRSRQEKINLNSKADYISVAETYIQLIPQLFDGFVVSDQTHDYLLDSMFKRVYDSESVNPGISVTNKEFTPWLDDKRDSIHFRFWKRYKAYLKDDPSWSDQAINTLDIDSDKILDFLGDPTVEDSWHRRGLMIGDIQAGKTANYTAVINKAADAGYKIVIVLTGMTENLRVQTQRRLNTDFVGVEDNKTAGVGLHKYAEGKDFPTPYDRTTASADFNKAEQQAHNYPLVGEKVSLFVLKKNKSILKRLNDWLQDFLNDNHLQLINTPLLFVDDECDYASVNTKDPDQDPTAINGQIRLLLKKFVRTSYLAVSATPFANIFIDSDCNEETFGNDLFPADYIYLLQAADRNPNYLGANKLFVDSPDPKYRQIIEYLSKDKVSKYIPLSHKKELAEKLKTIADLPPSLMRAIRYFLLAQGALDVVEANPGKFRSMMINVSTFTNVQNRIWELITHWFDEELCPSVHQYQKMPEAGNRLKDTEYYQLKLVWDEYHFSEKVGMDWASYSRKYLWNTISPVKIFKVNQSKDTDPLDYEKYKDTGLRVIAVGGLSLSRGLTLKGLLVSYFYRNTKNYDTLMQMGRWFGYRSSDVIKFFKIWMTKDAEDNYEEVNDAIQDLKVQILRMNRLKQTPRDFGLMVRRNIYSQLMITARNKLKSAEKSERIPIIIAGRFLETPRLYADTDIINQNAEVLQKFVAEASKIGTPLDSNANYCVENGYWQNVPKPMIARFVRDFKADKLSLNYQSEAIATYIENDANNEKWDVGFAFRTLKGKDPSVGFLEYQVARGVCKVPVISHTSSVVEGVDGVHMLKINDRHVRIGSGNECRLGMCKEFYDKDILPKWKAMGASDDRPSFESYLLQRRTHPLLVIFNILPDYGDATPKEWQINRIVQAIGLGFPLNKAWDDNRTYVYYLNPVAKGMQLEFNFGGDEGDE